MKIAQQLSITLANHPGSLARMSDILRSANVNINALFCSEGQEQTNVHLVVDDPETAKMVLGDVGHVLITNVLAIPIKNAPGSIAKIARMCAGAAINIIHIYATSFGNNAMIYLEVDDLEKTTKALKNV